MDEQQTQAQPPAQPETAPAEAPAAPIYTTIQEIINEQAAEEAARKASPQSDTAATTDPAQTATEDPGKTEAAPADEAEPAPRERTTEQWLSERLAAEAQLRRQLAEKARLYAELERKAQQAEARAKLLDKYAEDPLAAAREAGHDWIEMLGRAASNPGELEKLKEDGKRKTLEQQIEERVKQVEQRLQEREIEYKRMVEVSRINTFVASNRDRWPRVLASGVAGEAVVEEFIAEYKKSGRELSEEAILDRLEAQISEQEEYDLWKAERRKSRPVVASAAKPTNGATAPPAARPDTPEPPGPVLTNAVHDASGEENYVSLLTRKLGRVPTREEQMDYLAKHF